MFSTKEPALQFYCDFLRIAVVLGGAIINLSSTRIENILSLIVQGIGVQTASRFKHSQDGGTNVYKKSIVEAKLLLPGFFLF